MARRKWTNIEINDIVSKYNNGMSSIKIGELYKTPASNICSLLKRRGNVKLRSNALNNRKYNCNHDFFDEINTEEKAYWLGFLYADGYVSSAGDYNEGRLGLSLGIKDYNHLEKFSKSFSSEYPIKTYKTGEAAYVPGREYCRVCLSSKKLYEAAIRHGVFEHKTSIVKPPDIEKRFNPSFIRGYFDGDGCHTNYLHQGRRTDSIKIVGTRELLEWIESDVQENTDIERGHYFKRKPEQTVFSLEFSAIKKSFLFLDYIYNDASIYLNRKYESYIDLLSYIHSRQLLKNNCLKHLKLTEKHLKLISQQQKSKD